MAQAINTAVTDGSDTLRYTAGEDAKALMTTRSDLDDAAFIGELKTQFKLD